MEFTPVLVNSSHRDTSFMRAYQNGTDELHYLLPFTWYKIQMNEKGEKTDSTVIGLFRTWPFGEISSIYCNCSFSSRNFFPWQLIILTAPNITVLHGEALSHHEIELRWSEPTPANGELRPYEVFCVDGKGHKTSPILTTKRIARISNLMPHTEYRCTLKASTQPEKKQDPKVCEVLVHSRSIRTPVNGRFHPQSIPLLLWIDLNALF